MNASGRTPIRDEGKMTTRDKMKLDDDRENENKYGNVRRNKKHYFLFRMAPYGGISVDEMPSSK